MLLAAIVDGKKEDTFPDKQNHKYIGYVCNNDDAIVEFTDWVASIKNIKEPTVCTLKFETVNYFTDYLKQSGELVTFTHEDTEQTGSNTNTDYRYVGSDPNNYVRFNDELWRIIGVFNTDDGTGKYEERVKLIRDESIGNISWDTNYTNNWANSSLQNYLNGEYYNSLTENAKLQTDIAKWYLGSYDKEHEGDDSIYLNLIYKEERGIKVIENNPIFLNKIIGIEYISDLGYSSPETCFDKNMNLWTKDFKDVCGNSWLYKGQNKWTLTTSLLGTNRVLYIGGPTFGYSITEMNIFPSLYLKSDITTTSGDGSKDNPYILNLK